MPVCWEGKSCSLSQDVAVHPWLQWEFDFCGVARGHRETVRNACLGGMSQQLPTGNAALPDNRAQGPPTLACTPRHRDLWGPQPGHWVSPAQLTRSQADLGRDPLKRPHSSPIALGRLSPVPRAGTERAGTVLGPWEPLPKPWPCSRPHGKARGTDPRSPRLCHHCL